MALINLNKDLNCSENIYADEFSARSIVNYEYCVCQSIQFHKGIYYYKIRLFTKNSLVAERHSRSFLAATPGRNSRSFYFIRAL